MKLQPGERRRCSCGVAIVGALTIKGNVAPIEVDPVEDGNVWLGRGTNKWLWRGQVMTMPPGHDPPVGSTRALCCAVLGGLLLDEARRQGMALYLNHFATCEHADRYATREDTA